MANERDVWRTASELIDAYGDYAPRYALGSAALLVERGDIPRTEQWRRASAAAASLLDCPGAADTIH